MSLLSDKEIDELASFLESEVTGDECMDISMLDGFLTAIVVGPEPIELEEWVDEIWGDEEPEFVSEEEADYVIGLLYRYYQSLEDTLAEVGDEFEPLFYEREVGGKVTYIVDEWCVGFMTAVAMRQEAWQGLERAEEGLLEPVRLFGTEAGWDALEQAEDELAMHNEWVPRIAPLVARLFEQHMRRNSH